MKAIASMSYHQSALALVILVLFRQITPASLAHQFNIAHTGPANAAATEFGVVTQSHQRRVQIDLNHRMSQNFTLLCGTGKCERRKAGNKDRVFTLFV